MFVVISLIVLAGAGLLVKFRTRLTFPSGRLSRVNGETNVDNSSLAMGSDQFIELSFGKVHYIYRPSSKKSSSELNIFVHGYSIPMEMWRNVYLALVADDRPCLVFDLYGRGWSDAPDTSMIVDLFVGQIAELLFALNVPYEKYNLFGISMGGKIVQRFTQLYPSKIARLTLCCSVGLNDVKPSKILLCLLSTPILGGFLFKLVMKNSDNKSVRAQWSFPDRDEYRQYQNLFKRTCRDHPGFLRSLLKTVLEFDFILTEDSIASIAQHRIPTLILWGEQDVLTPVQNAYKYHRLYQHSSLRVIKGANHSLLIEHPKETIEAIQEFLA